jgi:hypothetical protein
MAGGIGAGRHFAGSNSKPFMSALGQKQTLQDVHSMSALPPKADIETQSRDVRIVPKADKVQFSNKVPLFDQFVSIVEHRRRKFDAECLGRFQV